MANSIKFLLILAIAVVSAKAQLRLNGGNAPKCPKVKAVADFSVAKFAGVWYEIGSVPIKGIPDGQCTWGNYTLESPTKGRIVGSEVRNGKTYSVNQTFALNSAANSGSWKVQIPGISASAALTIVDTDYVTYAVIHGCAAVSLFKFESSSILSRTPTLDQSFYNNAITTLKSQKLPTNIENVQQTNCPNRAK